ncbi:lipid IV(A) 3-deoxy-D-manno-octulosonic acid transferase [Vibrio sp. FNV 38]|nr:lipid IV(A) 3-deoxy-D-manno-octulosonic acid transferase [Vibrio sp. FNV 38]
MPLIIRWVYSLLLIVASPLFLWGLYRSRPSKPKFGSRWKEHFGITPRLMNAKKGCVWVHAVSVGEVLASKALLIELTKQYPEKIILVTTTTSTGAEQVERIGFGIVHRYMPLDFSWSVQRFVNTINPDVLFIIETEIWPNTIHTVAKAQVPIILVNGRLSEKSLKGYQRSKWLIAPALSQMQQILTVEESDKQRFAQLGVDESKLLCTGNLKYNVSIPSDTKALSLALKQQIGPDRKVLVAASTHQGEDEILLAAFKTIKQQHHDLLLILVPRHPERFDSVEDLINDKGLVGVRRTEVGDQLIDRTVEVYLADTMGEMFVLLSVSNVVFMGGSLLGKKVGGHNFIEPLAQSKPCVTGPSYYNFAEIGEELIQLGALSVATREKLPQIITDTLSNPPSVDTKWQQYIQSRASSVSKTMSILENYLK